jgi:hypothetical protein
MNRVICFFVVVSGAWAQPGGPCLAFNWDKLNARASQKTNISLEGPILQMAARFLGDSGDDAKVKQLVQGLKCVSVRSFTFDRDGQYSEADLNEIHAQVKAPGWAKIVDMQDKHESSEVYLKADGNQYGGVVIVSTEPKQLTVVQVIGPVDPAMLSELGGNLGIPKIKLDLKDKTKKKED